MWSGREERVEPEITVSNFELATSKRTFRINQRITTVRRDWNDRGENM